MGYLIKVEIFNIEKTISKKVKALVDTEASLAVLPKEVANELGIEVVSEDKVMPSTERMKK